MNVFLAELPAKFFVQQGEHATAGQQIQGVHLPCPLHPTQPQHPPQPLDTFLTHLACIQTSPTCMADLSNRKAACMKASTMPGTGTCVHVFVQTSQDQAVAQAGLDTSGICCKLGSVSYALFIISTWVQNVKCTQLWLSSIRMFGKLHRVKAGALCIITFHNHNTVPKCETYTSSADFSQNAWQAAQSEDLHVEENKLSQQACQGLNRASTCGKRGRFPFNAAQGSSQLDHPQIGAQLTVQP